MLKKTTDQLARFLKWSERYTGTDMIYLARGGFWTNLSSLSISLLSLGLYVAFAHFLPKDVYGTYQYLLSIAATVSIFTLTGVNAAVARSVARGYEGSLRATIRPQILWSLVPSAGALLGAGYYALQGNMVLAAGFLFIAISIPFTATFNVYSAYLFGKKDFRRVFIYNLALNIPYYGGLTLAAYFFKLPLVILAVNLFITSLGHLILYRVLLRDQKPRSEVDPEVMSYGRHLSAMGVLTAIVSQIDNILVFHYLGPVELAIYSFATGIPDRVANFFSFFSITALPKFAEKSHETVRATIGPKLIKLTLLAALSYLGYLIAAPFFFQLFFPQYMDSMTFSMLYALSMVGIGGNVVLSALTGLQRTKDLYIYNIITPMLQIILQLGGILLYGLWGLVIGKTISTLLAAAIACVLLLRKQWPVAPLRPVGSE